MSLPRRPSPFNAHLGARVKMLRLARAMRVEALAAALDVSHMTIRSLEAGGGCRADTLATLARVFEVSLADLVGLPASGVPARAATPA